jgi:hypothetical protein
MAEAKRSRLNILDKLTEERERMADDTVRAYKDLTAEGTMEVGKSKAKKAASKASRARQKVLERISSNKAKLGKTGILKNPKAAALAALLMGASGGVEAEDLLPIQYMPTEAGPELDSFSGRLEGRTTEGLTEEDQEKLREYKKMLGK